MSDYVATALNLVRKTPRGEVSAGQVAYHAHGKSHDACKFDMNADDALKACGLFERASIYGGGRFTDVTIWRVKGGK